MQTGPVLRARKGSKRFSFYVYLDDSGTKEKMAAEEEAKRLQDEKQAKLIEFEKKAKKKSASAKRRRREKKSGPTVSVIMSEASLDAISSSVATEIATGTRPEVTIVEEPEEFPDLVLDPNMSIEEVLMAHIKQMCPEKKKKPGEENGPPPKKVEEVPSIIPVVKAESKPKKVRNKPAETITGSAKLDAIGRSIGRTKSISQMRESYSIFRKQKKEPRSENMAMLTLAGSLFEDEIMKAEEQRKEREKQEREKERASERQMLLQYKKFQEDLVFRKQEEARFAHEAVALQHQLEEQHIRQKLSADFARQEMERLAAQAEGARIRKEQKDLTVEMEKLVFRIFGKNDPICADLLDTLGKHNEIDKNLIMYLGLENRMTKMRSASVKRRRDFLRTGVVESKV